MTWVEGLFGLLMCHSEFISESRIMSKMKNYYVYIMSNKSRTLYIGVTSNLEKRVYQHKHKLIDGFTEKYNLTRLVYFETTTDITSAIRREKQLKNWHRQWKVNLIESVNKNWHDLSDDWSG